MASKTEQIEFVKSIYPAANRLHRVGGVCPLFVTAQAALETGYKVKGIGNNIFGITKGSGWNGSVSLELTTEYFNTPNVKFNAPERVVSVEKIGDRYKYRVYRYFRVFSSLDECLDSHLALLRKPIYADAWTYRDDAKEFARRIVDSVGGKYATAPNYAPVMASIIDNVAGIVKNCGL